MIGAHRSPESPLSPSSSASGESTSGFQVLAVLRDIDHRDGTNALKSAEKAEQEEDERTFLVRNGYLSLVWRKRTVPGASRCNASDFHLRRPLEATHDTLKRGSERPRPIASGTEESARYMDRFLAVVHSSRVRNRCTGSPQATDRSNLLPGVLEVGLVEA